MNCFFERRAECCHQRGRQFADESHCIGQHNLITASAISGRRQVQLARGRIERCEQLVSGVGICPRQGIEQGRFSRIRVTHQ